MGQRGNNEFRLECFTPVMTPSMAGYYNDDWVLGGYMVDGYKYSRNYTSIGFSGSYARKFKDFKVGCRAGLVTRKVQESDNFNYTPNNISSEYFNYDQKHVMGSLFIAREEKIKFVSIQLGLEIPFIHYGKGTSVLGQHFQEFESGKLIADHHYYDYMTTGSGYATGLGGNLSVACQLGKGMSLGMEICEYLLKAKFSKPSSFERIKDEHFISQNDTRYSDTQATLTMGYDQLGFSRVVFRMFYSVKF